MALTFGSLFAGIGGFDLGLERAGMACKWQVEIKPFCQQVLAKHWPDVPRYGDILDVTGQQIAAVDLICGGFPCQDVSIVGQRAGLKGKRSTLWAEFNRLICEVRPRWVVVENVRGLYSSDDGRFFGSILRDLARNGYDAEWDMLPAWKYGAPHGRDRVYIVAYPTGALGVSRLIRGEISDSETNHWQTPKWGVNREVVELGASSAGRLAYEWRDGKCQPGVLRVVNGVPNQLDRLGALGNAVVPQIAEWIGRRIMVASA